MSSIKICDIKVSNIYGRASDLRLIGLSPGLNVIYGQNGSGKSTLAYAASKLFSPVDSRSTDYISATVRLDGAEEVHVALSHKRLPADLPLSSRRDLYRLRIDELISGPGTDDDRLIQEAFAGGVALATLLPRITSTSSASVMRGLRAATQAIRASDHEAATLMSKQQDVAGLNDNIARDMAKIDLVNKMQNILDARLEDCKAEHLDNVASDLMERFPGLDLQLPHAKEIIESQWTTLEQATALHATLLEKLARHGGNPRTSDLSAEDHMELEFLVSEDAKYSTQQLEYDTHIRGLKSAVEDAKAPLNGRESASGLDEDKVAQVTSLDNDFANASTRVIVAQGALDRASQTMKALNDTVPETYKPAIEAANLDAIVTTGLASAIDTAHKATAKQDVVTNLQSQLTAKLNGLSTPNHEIEGDRDLLVRWLQAAPDGLVKGAPNSPFIVVAITVALLGSVLVVAGLTLTSSTLTVVAYVTAAFLCTLAVWLFMSRPSATSTNILREQMLKPRAQALGLTEPTTVTVVQKIEGLITQRERKEALNGLLDNLRTLQIDGDSEAMNQRVTAAVTAFQDATGLLVSNEYLLAPVVDRLESLRAARTQYQNALDELEDAESSRSSIEVNRRTLLSELGAPADVTDGASLKNWMRMSDTLRTAVRRLRDKEDELAAIQSNAHDNAKKILRLIQDLEYRPANVFQESIPVLFQGFNEWLTLSQDCRTQEQAKRDAEDILDTTLSKYGVTGSTLATRVAQLVTRSPYAMELAENREGARVCRSTAKSYREQANLSKKDWDLLDIEEATPSTEIQALIDYKPLWEDSITQCRDEIEKIKVEVGVLEKTPDSLDLQLAVTSGRNWIANNSERIAREKVTAFIENAVKLENTAPVVDKANTWLMRLTNGRYTGIHMSDGKKREVVVTDLVSNRNYASSELATGNRTHLALAIRLASIDVAEPGGVRFPLFLDEVMATSDPCASRAIALAAMELSRERQVIILTNQPDDIAILTEAGLSANAIHSLGNEQLPIVMPMQEPPNVNIVRDNGESTGSGVPLRSHVGLWHPNRLGDVLSALSVGPTEIDTNIDVMLGRSSSEIDKAIIAAVEVTRLHVLPNYPGYEWNTIKDLVTGTFKERIQQLLYAHPDDPRAFLEAVDNIGGVRTAMKDNLLQLLTDRGCFPPPLSRKFLTEVAFDVLHGETPSRRLCAVSIARLFASYTTDV